MENFAMKYHPYSTYAASLGECERLAIKISRATGEEKLKLVRKRKNTCARSLARSLARTHARERPHTHTHTQTHTQEKEAYKVEIKPLSTDILKSLRQSLIRKAGEVKEYGTVQIPGQGVGYPSVYGYISACAMFHRLFGLAAFDPSRDAIFLASVKELRDCHQTRHTSLLDVLEDLPYIRQAVFSNRDLSDGEKIHLWALILVMLEHGCRISEVTVYSPTLDQVNVPASSKTHCWDSNGFVILMRMRMRTHARTRAHTHTHTHTHTRIRAHTHSHTLTHSHIHTGIRKCLKSRETNGKESWRANRRRHRRCIQTWLTVAQSTAVLLQYCFF
jgi:hypothetical protein